MLKLRFRKISSPFRDPFTTTYETKTQQDALQVAIEYNGYRGIGEAPIISYYDISYEKMVQELKAKAQLVEQYSFTIPHRFWHFCHHLFPTNNFLVCALDLAYWDLYSQMKKQSVAQIATEKEAEPQSTFYTLGQDNYEKMRSKMQAQPWSQYKVKITSLESIEILKKLKAETNSDFAVDANAAWSLEEAEEYIPLLQEMGVLFIEQPLAKDNFEGMKILKEKYDVPFFADESFQTESDLEKCADSFDGINIKLTKCSGLTPAISIINKAKELDLKTMLGCMNEAETGIYLAAQIGGMVDYRDLDGALLLDIPLKKIKYEGGKIIFT